MSSRVDADSGRLAALRDWLSECRTWIEEGLQRRVPAATSHPERLHEALRYALFGGGKRLRPALVRTVCRELGGSDEDALPPAAALELVHTYSLVHDDLPCMDDDDLRRGRPTCHVAYDEATAVLVGDALLTLAFEVLTDGASDGGAEHAGRAARWVAVLARDAGAAGMVGGQVIDLSLERSPDPTRARVLVGDLHARKTAALFAAAAEMGALAAAVSAERAGQARAFGHALGLCFQAVDDLLDETGDAATLGKTPGKDEALERPTLVAALGLEGARRRAAELGEEARGAAAALGWGPGTRAHDLVGLVLERST